MRARILFLAFLALAPRGSAQNESKLGAEFRREGEHLGGSCSSFRSALSCAEVLFTDHPLHIAVGNIAPQNGFGAGLAFVSQRNTKKWRFSLDTDAVGSNNGSWRAGVYLRAIFTPPREEQTTEGRPTASRAVKDVSLLHPVFHVYAQAISLNKIDYFGLGPSTMLAGRSFYGMREIIPGVNVYWPIFMPKIISLFGEVNGRLLDIRGSYGQPSPSIQQLYTDTTAPGLFSQPRFLQLGEGIRLQPKPFNGRIRLNYFVTYQQFLAPSDSRFSFQRFAADLGHEIPLYSTTRILLPRDANGPDNCSNGHTDEATMTDAEKKEADKHPPCPRVTRNREGSINFRFLLTESFTPSGHVVPFYFQPTLGGGDINGNPSLSSYQDYRFRAPNVMLIRQSFEHSLWSLPIGFTLMADEGKVALNRGDLGPNPWFHSFSAGLTLRAGGFPQVYLLFSWGGKEGTHTIANVNTSLLGGAARPSLY